MTTVVFKLRTQDGSPIANTWFKVEPGYPDSVATSTLPESVLFQTNQEGNATISLVSGTFPYFITRHQQTTEEVVAYKFFIPASTVPLEATMLFVDLGLHLRLKNDASLAALIDAKVSVLNALEQIRTLSAVLDARLAAAGV